MAITRDGTGATAVSIFNGISITITFTTNANRLLVITGSSSTVGSSNGLPFTITDSGGGLWTVLSKSSTVGTDAGKAGSWIAYSVNRSPITSVIITFPESLYSTAKLDQYAGVKTTNPLDTNTSFEGTISSSSFFSGSLTVGNAGCLVIASALADDSGAGSWNAPSGGWTELYQYGDTSNNVAGQAIYRIASGTTGPFSYTFVYPNMAASGYAGTSVMASFLPASPSDGSWSTSHYFSWSRQPQTTTRITNSNPFAKGIVFAALPYGLGSIDVISGQTDNAGGMSVPRINSSGAATFRSPPTTNFSFTNPTGMDSISGPFTLFFEGCLNAQTGALTVQSAEAGAGNGFGCGLDWASVVSKGLIYWANATTSATSAGGAFANEFEIVRVAVTHDGSTVRFYRNGILWDSVANTSLPISNVNRRTRILASYFGPSPNGLSSVTIAWNRVLSPTEIFSISGNPWQLFS